MRNEAMIKERAKLIYEIDINCRVIARLRLAKPIKLIRMAEPPVSVKSDSL